MGTTSNQKSGNQRGEVRRPVAGCSNCHIPTDNWFIGTCTYPIAGIRDVVELAKISRDITRRNHGITCRKCHDVSEIRAPDGVHARLAQSQSTDVDCHSVHAQLAAVPTG